MPSTSLDTIRAAIQESRNGTYKERELCDALEVAVKNLEDARVTSRQREKWTCDEVENICTRAIKRIAETLGEGK